MDDARTGNNGVRSVIDLFSSTQIILRDAKFTTQLVSDARVPSVWFEDDALMGFGCVFDTPQDLITQWKLIEASLLSRFSPTIRAAGDKAWNVCLVLLCAAPGDPAISRRIRWIEEDLERTRKIAGCGILSREDLVKTLLPLLPLQNQPALEPEDASGRLRQRVRFLAPRAADVLLDSAVSPSEVVKLLGESL